MIVKRRHLDGRLAAFGFGIEDFLHNLLLLFEVIRPA